MSAPAAGMVLPRDKAPIERFLRRNPFLHGYELGDLDDAFWPHTTWFGLIQGGALAAVALLYTGLSKPTLLTLAEEDTALRSLLQDLRDLLPPSFYCHLSPGLAPILKERFRLEPGGEHLKMGLTDLSRLGSSGASDVRPLTSEDADDLQAFYDHSYPGHWFEPQVLATGQYFGVREQDSLACVAGVHVYSPSYKVAALGNIATRPDRRGKGLAAAVTAALCRSLLKTVTHISLNVKADNRAAIACYEKLGFTIIGRYEEWSCLSPELLAQ